MGVSAVEQIVLTLVRLKSMNLWNPICTTYYFTLRELPKLCSTENSTFSLSYSECGKCYKSHPDYMAYCRARKIVVVWSVVGHHCISSLAVAYRQEEVIVFE